MTIPDDPEHESATETKESEATESPTASAPSPSTSVPPPDAEPTSVPPAASAPPPPRPSTPPIDDEEDDDFDDDPRDRSRGAGRPDPRGARRSGFEGLLRDSFKKAVERGLEVGLGTLKSADHVVRNVADEVKLPKEISNYLFTQIDETKNVLIKAVAGEVRSFLDSTDLATELQRALTALAFEVRMEIRFIPNEKGELEAKVRTKAAPRARRPERRPSAKREDDED